MTDDDEFLDEIYLRRGGWARPVLWGSWLVLLVCFVIVSWGYRWLMLWTILIILAIVALVLFILGHRRV